METTVDFTNYKFRCSSLGKLMADVKIGLTEKQEELFNVLDERYKGNGKPLTDNQKAQYFELGDKKFGKNVGSLSQKTTTYLRELHAQGILRREKTIQSKYLDKGIQAEEKSITLYSHYSGTFFTKNDKTFENDYIKGTPDNNWGKIRDIKSSWDFSTFPFYDSELPNSDYEWQVRGYMELTDLDEAEVIYCLVDTPIKLVNDELRRLDWKENILSYDGNVRKECIDLVVEKVCNLIYTEKGLREFCDDSPNIQLKWFDGVFREVPEHLRVKIFHVKKDPIKIQALYNRIKVCREHLDTLSLEFAKQLEVML